MWQGVLGNNLVVHAAGNHELDWQTGNAITYKDGPSTYGYTALNALGQPNIPFQSWTARHPNGALPVAKIGDIWSSTWFSQNLGPVHLVVLNNYLPFHPGTAQYNFFVADMAAVNRTQTPWLIISFHAPPYHSYYVHYKEMEWCVAMRPPKESLPAVAPHVTRFTPLACAIFPTASCLSTSRSSTTPAWIS
jgi:hypothetical protein